MLWLGLITDDPEILIFLLFFEISFTNLRTQNTIEEDLFESIKEEANVNVKKKKKKKKKRKEKIIHLYY